ncbi:hypothetical protein O181_014759 [Austropuccinia psidii MF-1]|uniref:BD-FAE-like domain-containing protein n=1 Tax=Austropuccinia psidii MF-1 TaxID=1389203 RepID=A0A9Q3GQ62_9BASI|nr:hypothetical protein [Austropuccinia psidii MF-1]
MTLVSSASSLSSSSNRSSSSSAHSSKKFSNSSSTKIFYDNFKLKEDSSNFFDQLKYFLSNHPNRKIITSNHSTISTLLLSIIIPISIISIIFWPFFLFFTCLPITSFITFPFFLALSILILFSLAWIPYLLFAQDDLPSHSSYALLLPYSPFMAQRTATTLIRFVISIIRLNWIEVILDYSYRRIIVVGGKKNSQSPILKSNINYHPTGRHRFRKLDVYLPPNRLGPNNSNNHDQVPVHHLNSNFNLAPVFVFIHPGGWRWFDKSHFLQLGLRIRRLGFCVVIPNFVQFPQGRCDESLQDIRHALNWVYRSIGRYGGDRDRIFLAGHGSGAHLSLLTVLKSAIVESIPSSLNSVGIDQSICIPPIEGMILLSGIYDPIMQFQSEVQAGWHQVSALRRALGPTDLRTLSHSPTHLLHWAEDIFDIQCLPAKFLIIHGGLDYDVPILQSHLLSTLLENLNNSSAQRSSCSSSVDSSGEQDSLASYNQQFQKNSKKTISVRFKAFKSLDHLNCLLALMMVTDQKESNQNCNKMIIQEILNLVND